MLYADRALTYVVEKRSCSAVVELNFVDFSTDFQATIGDSFGSQWSPLQS